MKHVTKKRVFLLTLVVLALGLGGGAFAYFSGGAGTGTGTAHVGTQAAVVLSSGPIGDLYPSPPGAALPVNVNIHNPGGGSEYVNTISGTVADNGGCLGAWFTVSPIVVQALVVPGDTAVGPAYVTLVDNGGNQDVCQNATMTIHWSSN